MTVGFTRLSDAILKAVEVALDQGDALIAEQLMRNLELSLTRNAGGADFVERRSYPDEIQAAIEKLEALKKQ